MLLGLMESLEAYKAQNGTAEHVAKHCGCHCGKEDILLVEK